MYESRCGVRCNTCERKEEVGCKGCIEMKAPFWGGVCGVKACCEERRLDHCGLCSDFPCEMLGNMGKDQGYDPTVKIDQCASWRDESNPQE